MAEQYPKTTSRMKSIINAFGETIFQNGMIPSALTGGNPGYRQPLSLEDGYLFEPIQDSAPPRRFR